MGRNQRRWQKKHDACERLARDQAGTAEGRAAAAKAAKIKAEHLQPAPQPRRWGRGGLPGLVEQPESAREKKARRTARDRYQRQRQDDGQRYSSGNALPRKKHEKLGQAAAEKLDRMTPGERRRWLARQRRR